MKTRRLLAFVLCLAMLFSDATSTLASTLPDEGIIVSDDSELMEVLDTEAADTQTPGTEVPETDVTGTEEVTSTETTEVVVPEGTEEAGKEETETSTEVEEDTEVVIEVVEDIKATSTTSLTVGYTDENDQWVEIGTNPYTSFTDALTGINTFLADPFNGAFSKAVQINMEADATLDCELDLGSDDVPLNLNMNGYTLSVTENRTIRANVWTPNEQSAGTIAVGAGLTLSIKAFDPLGYGMSDDEDWEIEQGQTDIEHTNWQNVVINFDSTNKGDLIIGQEENNGESTTANIRLNDVYINHAKNVTIEGNVGIEGIEVDPSDIQFDVAETINVNNKGDDAYVNHYVEILVPTTCQNLVWYTSGAVADLTVSDTVTADIQSDLNVNGQFTVNDIYVEEYWDDPWGYFGMATHHLYQADGTLISAGTITINGQVTCDEALHVPLNFRKHKWAYASDTAEEPDHLGVFAYTEGEVVATAPNLNRQLVSLSDAETGIRLFADRNEQGQLIAEKPVVEVTYWNDDTNEFEKYLSYTSLEDAVAGMKTEFGEAAGQYIINIYDDIKLNEDIELPDFATYVRVEPLYRHIDVYDEEDNYDYTYYETTFVNVDFNGHTISVNGSVEWSEAIAMTNSADTEAQLYLRGDDTALEIRIEFNEPGETYAYVNAAGETIARPESEYTWIEGVDINIPNGTLFLDMYDSAEFVPSDDITRILDTDITAERVDIQSGTWKITNLSLAENEYASRVKKDAILTVTGTLTAVGGDSFEIRGALLVADIVVMPNSQDAYANFRFIVEKEYGPENPDQLSYMGDLIFTGNVTGGEGLLGTPVGIGKTNVILNYELDEEGNIMYEDDEQQRPYLSETYQWEDEVTYENGEILAYIEESSTLNESMIVVNREGVSLLIEDGKLKIGEEPIPEDSKVIVDCYIEGEDRNIFRGYKSVEEAFANMAADFGSRQGTYTITALEDITLTENITVPDFVTRIRWQSKSEWIEHLDENDEPIYIYDNEDNIIGVEGHERITALKLDMSGHSITANCDMEWSELFKIINDSDKASEIYITAEANPGPDGYWPSFRTAWLDENAELVYSDNSKFDFGAEHTWIDNVTIRVPNGSVEFETWDADGTHIINGELIVSSFKGIDGKWIVADVTIVGSTNGSFIREGAEVTITGQSTWLGGAGAEVRGTLTFGDININANDEDPYANMWVEIVEVYDRDKEDTDEYFIGKGKVTFAGAVETAENFKADKAVHISKKEVYYYQARDEHGNLLFHDEAQTDPMIWEDQYWDLPFESGETVAYVTDSSVNANQFSANGNGISLEIIGQELKAYKPAVFVDLYIEEEDRGFGFGYKTLEEALDNMERDFEGREGSYTFNILEDVVLLEDIVLPDFVRNLRLQSEWMWIEHRDEEGNVIEIYDEEGNFMGTEGHHDVYVSTLDMNGHSITTAGHIEVMEGLQVVSNAVNKGAVVKGELVSTTENGGVSIRQIDNGGLIEESGEPIEVSMDKPFVILDNVDVVAEKAHVDLWSLWGAYVANGDITTRFMNVRGTWTVEDVMVTTDLCLESGWYDEENDCGEPDGYLTADNVSIYGGHMYNGGRLVVKDTFTAKNSHIENDGILIADKLMVPSGEFHNFEQVSVKDAQIEWFYNHTDIMFFEDDDPETEDVIEERKEEWGSLFIADTFTQSGDAYSYMEGSSTLVVNKKAILNNLCVGAWNPDAENPPRIVRMPGAELEINEDIYPGDREMPVAIGIFNVPNDSIVGLGMVEVFDKDQETGVIYGSWFEEAFVNAEGEKAYEFGENGWWTTKPAAKGDVLFTTDISNVRTDLITIDQSIEEGKEEAAIWEVSQDGNKVVAGAYTIFVYSMEDNNRQRLRGFKNWSEAVAYIDSLANPNIGYAIELTEDIKLDGPLTLPKNATKLVICGLGDKKIELTCTGDISLSSLVAVTNIKLNASNSTVKLNGFNLIFDEGSIAYIGKAVGTKESILAAFNKSAIMIGKAVTGLAGLEVMWGSRIELGMDNTADASVAKKLQLCSSILVIHDSLTVEEVASWDDLNTVVVKDENSFTITGTVYGPDVAWNESYRQYVGETGVAADGRLVEKESELAKAKIRISAIDIKKFDQNSNFVDGDKLVTAPNVSAAWFVTGSIIEKLKDEETGEPIQDENGEDILVRTGIGSLTRKDGDDILCGEDTTEKLVELRIHDDAMGDFIPYDTYATLAEAFAAIDRIGNAEGFYRIVLMDDVEIATMTTPSKAQALQIWVEEDEEPKKITYDGDMKLNCRLIIANAILAPQSENSKIFVGNYVINLLYGTKLADGCKITGITGSGVAKGSEVILHDNEITISGDIKNVGVLCLQNSVLKVEGTVNVGDVISFEDDGIPEERRLQPTLIGTAKVTRKDGKVIKVEPQITFAGDTWYEQNVIHIALQEKQADGSYKLLDFSAAEMTDVLATGIPLVKAPKISSMMLLASKENKAGSYITAKDNGYVVVRKDATTVGVMLTFEYPFVRMEWNEEIGDYDYFDDVKIIETYCETVADAVTEINNLNTARPYEMILLPQNAAMTPASLKMPNAKALESLMIKAQTGVADLPYTGNITFTSDVVVENVNFVQVSKEGVAYVETDQPAAVSVSTGGKELTLNGKVTFNTPLKLDGKKNGTLNINGTLTTITYYDQYGICGSITNFAEVNIMNANENPAEKHNQIVLGDYGKETPVFSATVLNMDDYTDLIFYTEDRDAKLSVTDLTVSNGLIYVEGTVEIKNLEMDGETELDAFRKMTLTNVTLNGAPTIRGYREFTINGTVTSNTGNSVLRSVQKSASNRTPYLDIKGDVILANDACKIGVVVDDYMDIGLPKLEKSPNATGMLLTAKKASPDMFVPATVTIGNRTQNNIGDAKPYSEDKENGYVLMKSGNSIYVYYGTEIFVKLIDGTGEEHGYYRSITEAVNAIDAIKDKEASYKIILLDGYGTTADAAVELKLPKYASELTVMSDHKMYYKGKVTLSTSTALVVASEAEFAGNVTGKGTFAIGGGVTVTAKGKFDANNLVLNGGSVLDARQNVVTIGTIANNGSTQNKIIYGKDANNVTYLTVKGWVDGANTNEVLLQLMSDTDKAFHEVTDAVVNSAKLDNVLKLATIEKAALSSFEVMINEETFLVLNGESVTRQIVKANKGIYVVLGSLEANKNGTWLEFEKEGKTYRTYCLDFNQAVNEINNLADKTVDYTINFGRMSQSISDVNLLDKKVTSSITMPKANVANSVTVAYTGGNGQQGIEFTGNISYAGNLGFVNCEIEAAKISKVKTLTLDNTAFVTTGEVSVNNVVIKGGTTWDALGKTTIGNITVDGWNRENGYLATKQDKNADPTLTVTGDVIINDGNGAIPVNVISKASTATNISYLNAAACENTGIIIAKAAGAEKFVPKAITNLTNLRAYKDAKNVVKYCDKDAMNVKLTYGQNVTYVKSYDEAVRLINNIGDKQGRYVIEFLTAGQVTANGVKDSFGKLSFPSKAGLVTIKGMVGDEGNPTVLTYTGTIKTGVSVTFEDIYLSEGKVVKGEFTPSFAVTPATSAANVELTFGEGAMTSKNEDSTPTTDLVFVSVSGKGKLILDDRNVEVKGALNTGELKMDAGSTVSVGGDVKVTTLNIADNATLKATGKFTAKDVNVLDITSGEPLVAVIDADKAIAITNINGDDYSDWLRIVTNRTAGKNESQLTVSGQIDSVEVDVAMNMYDAKLDAYREMNMEDVTAMLVSEDGAVPTKEQKVLTAPKASTEFYVVTYEQIDEAGNKDWVYFGELPNENPSEEPDWITTYKHDGGMYITNLPVLLSVDGYLEDREYYACFMSWEQAVKEIDKIGNKNAYYEICLRRSVGQNLDGTLNPIKNLTLPSKAVGVGIIGENIYFTGTKITPKTMTEFVHVGLMAVKQVKEDGVTWYESTTYDMNIGNYTVGLINIYGWADRYENKPGTISGSKKGYLMLYNDKESGANETVATMIKGVGTVEFFNFTEESWASYFVPKGITGVQDLIMAPFTKVIASEGDISVKNISAEGATISAKNIKATGTTEIADTGLFTGTQTVGDGAIKLANVILNGQSGIFGKQDKKGNSLIQISGTISAGEEYEGETEGMLEIGLCYNNASDFVPLSNKLVLLTAPKADASWFVPLYEAMGTFRDGYGVYKLGKTIYYGKLAE